ncbi:MAG: replicative DNA helicase [Alphaproteobacteria bacterium]|nr:replicative DNA helicase [Alphaproteobacteria bacterium]MBE8219881.1 replicative DNA helicase [Alphaproteobacteria bacterium]
MEEQSQSSFTPEADASYAMPPQNLDAEQGLLGALLLDNNVMEQVTDFLNEAHFFDPVHQRIYDTISKMITNGNLASPVTLKTYLEADEGLAQVGGAVYLARLASNATTLANAKEYGRTIYDLALRRELIALGENMAQTAREAVIEQNPQDQIEAVEQSLYELAEKGPGSAGFMTFSHSLTGAVDMVTRAYESDGKLSGIDTGFIDLNALLGGFQPSDLVVLAGRPAMGKTALATNIAFHIAQEYQKAERDGDITDYDDGTRKVNRGGVVGFFSLEMSAEQLAMRLLVEHSNVAARDIRQGEIDDEEYERICNVSTKLHEIPLYIDHTGAIPMATLAARARRLKRQHGLDFLVIDYLQLVRASSGRSNDGRVQEVSEVTQGLKALAKELNIPILALSQLSRQVEMRDDKRPQLSDLRESGAIEQDADVVMFVFRESYYLMREKPDEGTDEFLTWQETMNEKNGLAEIIVGKNRHGATATIETAFYAAHTRFSNLIKDEQAPVQQGYGTYNNGDDDDDDDYPSADDLG